MTDYLDDLARTVALELAFGLPSRCECPIPFEVPSHERCAVLCEACGGLVLSDVERERAA
jgi:hypothetical protein